MNLEKLFEFPTILITIGIILLLVSIFIILLAVKTDKKEDAKFKDFPKNPDFNQAESEENIPTNDNIENTSMENTENSESINNTPASTDNQNIPNSENNELKKEEDDIELL